MLPLLSLVLGGSVLLFLVVRFALSTLRPHGFPPGPPTIPGIGNIHQIPTQRSFLSFTAWARAYGPVLGLKLGSKNLVVFNKAAYVRSQWVQRGAMYAGRPRQAVACDYVFPDDYHRQVLFMTPAFHKRQRAATKHHLSPAGYDRMKPFQQAFAARLMHDLLEAPRSLQSAIMRWGMGTPIWMISGRRLEDLPENWGEKYIELQHNWLQVLDPSVTPPLEIFPFLAWVPAKFVAWKRYADAVRKTMFEQYSALVHDVEHQSTKSETQGPNFESLVEKLLSESRSKSAMKEESFSKRDITFIVGGVFDGAFDTVYHTTSSLIKTLAAHPEIQKRIQCELDEAWGVNTGIPEQIDLAKLPYINCCVLEILRWRPVTPFALARRVMVDGEVAGYRIPKDTTALINVWAMQHDPDAYDDPDVYNPSRFMDNPLGMKSRPAGGADGAHEEDGGMPLYVFGAGRHACPGEQMAMNAIRLAIAQLLRSFDIRAGEDIDLSVETGYDAAFVLVPMPYKVDIVPRDEEARLVVRDQCRKANDFLSQAMS